MGLSIQFSIPVFLLVQWLVLSDSAKILMLSPMGTRSHMYSFMPIMEALAERGHDITVVTAHEPKTQTPNIRKIVMHEMVEHLEGDWQGFGRPTFAVAIKDFMKEVNTLQRIGYGIFMQHSEIKQIMETKNVDLVVVDAIMNEFTFPFIDSLNVPFIFHSASTGPPWSLAAFDVPQEYARIPSIASEFKTQMTFTERLINSVMIEVLLYARKVMSLRMLDDLARTDFPNARPIEVIERSAQLCLASSHSTTAWARPLPPTFIPIGALHVRPPLPLPEKFQKFADEEEHGFIVFTLGSNARSSLMADNVKMIFFNVFSRLPQRVFWKWEDESSLANLKIPDNVLLVNWMPQQDLLGHKKAKLFISHGGLLGNQEAVYHGVPILGLPLGRDQPSNLGKIEEEGYGIKLDWSELTEPLLYDSINKIINEPSFKGNVTRLSRLMRDELLPPKEIAAYWVEHVLRHNGTNHLQYPSKDMPFYQLYLLDVWLFVIGVVGIVLFLFIKLALVLIRMLIGKKNKEKSN